MITYNYIKDDNLFSTPSFELAHCRNETGLVTAQVTTDFTTPDYYFEQACPDCHVPQRHHVSGRVTNCGCVDSSENIAETWQQRAMHWHVVAINKRIYTPDDKIED